MALQISLPESNIGVPVPYSYAKITQAIISTDQCLLQVGFYASKEARNKPNAHPVHVESYVVPYQELASDTNALAAGYDYLRGLPAFAGAIDV